MEPRKSFYLNMMLDCTSFHISAPHFGYRNADLLLKAHCLQFRSSIFISQRTIICTCPAVQNVSIISRLHTMFIQFIQIDDQQILACSLYPKKKSQCPKFIFTSRRECRQKTSVVWCSFHDAHMRTESYLTCICNINVRCDLHCFLQKLRQSECTILVQLLTILRRN